jgi:hypothetical protein
MNYAATPIHDDRTLNWIQPDKVGHFLKLFSAVAAKVGGMAAASKFADVSESSIAMAKQKRELSDRQARKILAAYRRAKHL